MVGQENTEGVLAFDQDIQPGLDGMLIDVVLIIGCIYQRIIIEIVQDITMNL